MTGIKGALAYLFTAAAGATAKETAFSLATALAGLAAYLGGWDKGMQVLLALLVADYVTGVLGAVKQKKVNSEVMFWGGVRKAVVLAVIGLATTIDAWVSPDSPVFRTIAIYFYAAREGLSVFENLGELGIPMPGKLKDFFTQLSEQGGGEHADARQNKE